MYVFTGTILSLSVIIISILYQLNFFSKPQHDNRAWLTLLASEDYMPGVQALARSLKRVKTKYPLVVMMEKNMFSNDIQRLILNEGCSVVFIQDLQSNQKIDFIFARFHHVWKKLRAFELVDTCSKCVFMDADILVLQNMDELFDLHENVTFAAVQTCICNPSRNPKYPSHWNPPNCPYTHEHISFKAIDLEITEYSIFNSGLFFFRSSLSLFDQMTEALNSWNLTEFRFPDQDFLNRFFDQKWTRISVIYNALKTYSKTHPHLWDTSKIKAIHYILSKPWDQSDNGNLEYEDINKLWWEIYNHSS